jgi:hypothetical protein
MRQDVLGGFLLAGAAVLIAIVGSIYIYCIYIYCMPGIGRPGPAKHGVHRLQRSDRDAEMQPIEADGHDFQEIPAPCPLLSAELKLKYVCR